MNIEDGNIGISKWELDTPCLIVDLAAMERNLHGMAGYFAGRSVNLRPHVKTHNATPELAQMQVEAGAQGVTCAKLSEAEVLAAAGIKDILIANQVVGPKKIQRLVRLASHTDIIVAVDNYKNIETLSYAAQQHGVSIRVLVEVNIGHNRCGVTPFDSALALSRAVTEAPGLKSMGLMGYDGHCTLRVDETERANKSREANTLLVENRRFIEAAGIEVPIVSGSGTFTYKFAAEIDGITEIQAGTYLLMDTTFKEKGVRDFELTLSVMTTVISRASYPSEIGLAVIDTGRKSVSPLLGLPEVKHPQGAEVISLNQRHGKVALEDSLLGLEVGDKIELWVRDANCTINLFNRIYGVRDDIVEVIWEIPLCGIST